MEKWLIWCNLNAEQDELKKMFGNKCVSIDGRTSTEEKVRLEQLWREGDVPVLISKPAVFGFGMNWQHCSKMIFIGSSHSFEQWYQAVRRCWRFGQKRPVDVWAISSDLEGAVKANLERKERDAALMIAEMVEYTRDITRRNVRATVQEVTEYNPTIPMVVPDWLRSEAI